jgi:hypothetical protein
VFVRHSVCVILVCGVTFSLAPFREITDTDRNHGARGGAGYRQRDSLMLPLCACSRQTLKYLVPPSEEIEMDESSKQCYSLVGCQSTDHNDDHDKGSKNDDHDIGSKNTCEAAPARPRTPSACNCKWEQSARITCPLLPNGGLHRC